MKKLFVVLAILFTVVANAQWVETRTVYGEKVEIPYYMPYTRIPDFGWGFYYDWGRLPSDYRTSEYQRMCFRQMASMGLNTVTIYGWWGSENVADIQQQINLSSETGLAKRPVMLLPCGIPKQIIGNLKIPTGYPEIVGYGPDEPANTQESSDRVAASAATWHDAKTRCATAINAKTAMDIGEPLDIFIVHNPDLSKVETDKELWMYNCQMRGTNYDLNRYMAGIYSFAAHKIKNVKQIYWWAYVHDNNSGVFLKDGKIVWNALRVCEYALPGPNGPIPSVGMFGIRDGIQDFRILNEAYESGRTEYIDSIIKDVPLDFWTGTDHPEGPKGPDEENPNRYWWDVSDTAKPLIDVSKAMKEVCALINFSNPD